MKKLAYATLSAAIAPRLIGCKTVLAPFNPTLCEEINDSLIDMHKGSKRGRRKGEAGEQFVGINFEYLESTDEPVDCAIAHGSYLAALDMLPFVKPGGRMLITQPSSRNVRAIELLEGLGFMLAGVYDLEQHAMNVLLFFRRDSHLIERITSQFDKSSKTTWLESGSTAGRRHAARALGNAQPHEYLIP